MTSRKLIVFHSGHENDRIFCESVVDQCAEFGVGVVELNGHNATSAMALLDMVDEDPDGFLAVLGFGSYIFKFHDNGLPTIHVLLNVPLVIMLMDHPVYCMEEIPKGLPNTLFITGCVDHEIFWRKYRPEDLQTITVQNLMWLKKVEPDDLSYGAFKNRAAAVFAPVNLSMAGLSTESWWLYVDQKPELLSSISKQAFTMIAQDMMMDVDWAIDAVLVERSIELNEEDRIEASRCVDGMTKMWRRNFVIGCLIDLPIIVSSYHVPEAFAKDHFDKFINTNGYVTMEVYRRFQFVINIPPPRPNMTHDRILSAVNSGTTLISENSPGIQKYLKEGRDYIGFEYDPDSIRGQVIRALDDPRAAYDMTVSAKSEWDGQELNYISMGVLLARIGEMREIIEARKKID